MSSFQTITSVKKIDDRTSVSSYVQRLDRNSSSGSFRGSLLSDMSDTTFQRLNNDDDRSQKSKGSSGSLKPIHEEEDHNDEEDEKELLNLAKHSKSLRGGSSEMHHSIQGKEL